MTANVIVVVERVFDHPRLDVFRAWTDPEELTEWRGSPGWHVEAGSAAADLRLGGKHRHVKVRDDDPTVRVITDATFIEYFAPDVFVARQLISGDYGIDPHVPLELRVEFSVEGRDSTRVRIVQGPFDPAVAQYHAAAWEEEMQRCADFLDGDDDAEGGEGEADGGDGEADGGDGVLLGGPQQDRSS